MVMTPEEIIEQIQRVITNLDERVKEKDREFAEENNDFDRGWAGGAGIAYMIVKLDLEAIIERYRGENR